jgi:DNA invertase Pin-like site-specific DNA recombinase
MLEICALTGTLLVDEDGCYDPADFNDQLLLGLKGTMSQAELHFARASRAANAIKPGAENCVSSYPSDTSMERSPAAC